MTLDSKKIAIVTGANRGLGAEIARQLAARGFAVVIAARKASDAEAVAASLPGGVARPVSLDVADAASVERFAAFAREELGRVDVLVNNAGLNPSAQASEHSMLTVAPATVEATFATNALGPLRVIQAVLPLMQARRHGRIVNVSTEMASLSALDRDPYPLAISYRLSKVALNSLTALLAREFAGTDILINAYSPGWLRTDMGGPDAPFSAAEGAETALWLATLPVGGPQGKFFAEMRRLGTPVELPW